MRLRRIVTTGAAAAALALTACGDEDKGSGERNDYPAAAERNFLQACERTSNGKTDACQCLLEEVQKRMTFDEFKRDDTAIGMGGSPSRKFSDAVAECR